MEQTNLSCLNNLQPGCTGHQVARCFLNWITRDFEAEYAVLQPQQDGLGVQALLSRAASSMLRGRSSNLDAARAERPPIGTSPRAPTVVAPPATAGAVTLVSAVEGPDGRLIMDTVHMAAPVVTATSDRSTPSSPMSHFHAAGHSAVYGQAPAHADGQANAPARTHQQAGSEPAEEEVRIEMVQPLQPAQRTFTWVSPFANATFWPSNGSDANTPRDGPSRTASASARGFEAA